jgi:hypothetical protein
MYLVHIMNQIHHFFNVPKKSNLLIIVAGGSILLAYLKLKNQLIKHITNKNNQLIKHILFLQKLIKHI